LYSADGENTFFLSSPERRTSKGHACVPSGTADKPNDEPERTTHEGSPDGRRDELFSSSTYAIRKAVQTGGGGEIGNHGRENRSVSPIRRRCIRTGSRPYARKSIVRRANICVFGRFGPIIVVSTR